ncbi:MAG: hypothetical protein ACTSWG_13505 [Candidatus Helarchaeota archaeon]
MRDDIYRRIHSRFSDTVFADFTETLWVTLKASNSKGSRYDKYRDEGYSKTYENPYPVNAYVRQLQANSLIMRELGLVETGAIEVVVKEQDKGIIEIAEKIEYDSKVYSVFNKALGNRVQITKTPFGFYRIVLFRKV